jgi:hypothetical protein
MVRIIMDIGEKKMESYRSISVQISNPIENRYIVIRLIFID